MKEKKEKKLSKAELKRREAFEKKKGEYEAQGYQTQLLKIGALEANVFAVILAIPFIIGFVFWYQAAGNSFETEAVEFYIAFLVLLVLMVVHELIHGITFSLMAENGWKSVSFGIMLSSLTPYCNCNQPMKKGQMIIAALMPTVILGFLPAVIAVMNGSSFLLYVSMLMIIGGGGDFLIVINLLRYKSLAKEVIFLDHPYEIGTVVFER
ncbi:MAG: DUF3267 domain-containing protein [Lachnospiraceae bacterium]|nr:DUF3267 domain-containing protein [Lachnospiraceae bacterium]